MPLVIRAPNGKGERLSAQHSQSLEMMFVHMPGLQVVLPATPADAKGLLKSAIRENNPVVFLEHAGLYNLKGEVPEGEHLVPLGQAATPRRGRDCTLISWSRTVHLGLHAAERLAQEGIEVEVLDLRSLVPLDRKALQESVRRTHRAVVLSEENRTGSVAAEIASRIYELAFDDLDAPVEVLAGADVPMPYARNLERLAVPDEEAVVAAVRRTLQRSGAGRSPALEEQHGGSEDAQDGRRDGGRNDRPLAEARGRPDSG
jgi:pyruvate dehydrogenase E1 component beta subunit